MSGSSGSQQSGQQVDQQISQQLQQIAGDPRTAPDKLFVINTALGNQFEVQLAQAVQQKASSEQVKRIAQQLVQDHQQATDRLQSVAQKLSLQLPQGLTQMKQQELAIFTSLPADQMEKAFIGHMQVDHAKDVTEYRIKSQTAQDENVKQFAAAVLPKLEQHAAMIERAAVAMGLPAGGVYGEAQPAGARIGGDRSGSGTGSGYDRSGTSGSGGSSGTSGSGSGSGTSGSGGGTSGSGGGTSGGGGQGAGGGDTGR